MARRIALQGGQVLTPAGELERYTLLLAGGRIEALLPAEGPVPADAAVRDVTGCIVAPGFIDTHVHGGMGRNFMEGTPEAVAAISRYMSSGGVTACLATTTSAPLPDLLRAVGNAASAARHPVDGQVEVLGSHLEGPFVSHKYRGSHAERYVREATAAELTALAEAADGTLRIVTLAPEVPGGAEAVRFLAARGVQVSMGHTGATYAEAKAALALGVRRGTHVFNGMPPIHHRDPGPIVALLTDAGAFIELTVDGHHIAPPVVAMALRLAGPDRTLLITDGVDAAGQGDGRFTRWEGTEVEVKEGQARTLTGSLAGSTLRMDQAVANLVRLTGAPLATALRMATETPARSVGVLDRKGSLAPGKDADVVVLNAQLAVVLTIARGQIVYERRTNE